MSQEIESKENDIFISNENQVKNYQNLMKMKNLEINRLVKTIQKLSRTDETIDMKKIRKGSFEDLIVEKQFKKWEALCQTLDFNLQHLNIKNFNKINDEGKMNWKDDQIIILQQKIENISDSIVKIQNYKILEESSGLFFCLYYFLFNYNYY